MKILGITGSSGSGKSTFSQLLSRREDVSVIDADKVAKELSVPGTEYMRAIENTFGKEILLEDGNLNRKLLASKIYNDEEEQERLNALTVTYILKEIYHRMQRIVDEKVKYIVIDAPLLLETGLDKACDYVVVLIADKELQIERICTRDNIDNKTAESRLNIQQTDNFYIENADFVIRNERNCSLQQEADKLFNKLERSHDLENR